MEVLSCSQTLQMFKFGFSDPAAAQHAADGAERSDEESGSTYDVPAEEMPASEVGARPAMARPPPSRHRCATTQHMFALPAGQAHRLPRHRVRLAAAVAFQGKIHDHSLLLPVSASAAVGYPCRLLPGPCAGRDLQRAGRWPAARRPRGKQRPHSGRVRGGLQVLGGRRRSGAVPGRGAAAAADAAGAAAAAGRQRAAGAARNGTSRHRARPRQPGAGAGEKGSRPTRLLPVGVAQNLPHPPACSRHRAGLRPRPAGAGGAVGGSGDSLPGGQEPLCSASAQLCAPTKPSLAHPRRRPRTMRRTTTAA